MSAQAKDRWASLPASLATGDAQPPASNGVYNA